MGCVLPSVQMSCLITQGPTEMLRVSYVLRSKSYQCLFSTLKNSRFKASHISCGCGQSKSFLKCVPHQNSQQGFTRQYARGFNNRIKKSQRKEPQTNEEFVPKVPESQQER